jgi:hypothetical protein
MQQLRSQRQQVCKRQRAPQRVALDGERLEQVVPEECRKGKGVAEG